MERQCMVCGKATDTGGRRTCEHVNEPQKSFNAENNIIMALNESVMMLSNEREEAKQIINDLLFYFTAITPAKIEKRAKEFLKRNS